MQFFHLCSPIWKWFLIPLKWPIACSRERKKKKKKQHTLFFPSKAFPAGSHSHTPCSRFGHFCHTALGRSQPPAMPPCNPHERLSNSCPPQPSESLHLGGALGTKKKLAERDGKLGLEKYLFQWFMYEATKIRF